MIRLSVGYLALSFILLWPWVSIASSEGDCVLRFHIAGFKGPGYSINIDGSFVRYRSGPSYEESSLAWRRVQVGEKDLQEFMERLIESGVFDWQPQYFCPTVLDGVWWDLEASCSGRKVSSQGSNKFPPRFDDLQGSISELTRQPFGILSKDRHECRD